MGLADMAGRFLWGFFFDLKTIRHRRRFFHTLLGFPLSALVFVTGKNHQELSFAFAKKRKEKEKQDLTLRPKKKDSCVQVSEVKTIRVGRSKNIFILDFFFHYKCTEVLIEDRVLEVSFFNQSAHCID